MEATVLIKMRWVGDDGCEDLIQAMVLINLGECHSFLVRSPRSETVILHRIIMKALDFFKRRSGYCLALSIVSI